MAKYRFYVPLALLVAAALVGLVLLQHGKGADKTGASGDDIVLPVPPGTIVRDHGIPQDVPLAKTRDAGVPGQPGTFWALMAVGYFKLHQLKGGRVDEGRAAVERALTEQVRKFKAIGAR